MSDVEHTILDNNNGWGGAALGAGFGGLLGSWFGNSMNGNGWGGNNNNTFLANQLSAIQTQAVNNGLSNQQALASASQNTIEAINSNGRDTTDAVYQSNISAVRDNGTTNLTIAGLGANIAQSISNLGSNLQQSLCAINQNITNQGYEARLQAQELAAQLAKQHSDLSRQIFEENCKDRELQRQIQTEAISGALADAKAQNAILLQNQYLVSQLKTTAA